MKNAFVLAFALLSVSPAFASQSLTFDQLKDACSNPAKYHNQIPPTGIKVDCSDRQVSWAQQVDDAMSLPTSRGLGYSISSDKYTVPQSRAPLASAPMAAGCPVYTQFEETIAVSQSLTCDQLLAFQGGAVELCQQMVDETRAQNPAAIVRRATGQEVHLCEKTNEPTDDRGQRGQRGQR